jgi:hypothetical protein
MRRVIEKVPQTDRMALALKVVLLLCSVLCFAVNRADLTSTTCNTAGQWSGQWTIWDPFMRPCSCPITASFQGGESAFIFTLANAGPCDGQGYRCKLIGAQFPGTCNNNALSMVGCGMTGVLVEDRILLTAAGCPPYVSQYDLHRVGAKKEQTTQAIGGRVSF